MRRSKLLAVFAVMVILTVLAGCIPPAARPARPDPTSYTPGEAPKFGY